MFRYVQNRKQGFTLIELAIVLSIAGLLFVGLWRLLAGGNQQVRDQSAAAEQTQLISAVKAYLNSSQGQTYLGTIAANTSGPLALPTNFAACTGAPAGFCNYLPPGFLNTTVNSYGQTYIIRVLKDGTPALSPPSTYSFMIITTAGDIIPDTSGGRLSASIGNDGGFIYTNNICGANFACGAYGAWGVNPALAGLNNYNFGAVTAGHIATRTFVSPAADSLAPWLSRPFMTGDSTTTPVWNTMKTDLFLGTNAVTAAANTFWLGTNNTLTTGGGTINMQGGTITGQGTSQIILSNPTGGTPMINVSAPGVATALVNVSNGCVAGGVNVAGQITGGSVPGCTWDITAQNISAQGVMFANQFYAVNFNYNTASDIRFKKDIEPLKNALTDIMKLKPVSYRLKTSDEKSRKSMGVIAQDLEKVYPQLVTSGDMKYVKYEELIAPLIGAVQKLKGENDDLRQQLQTQEKRQNELEKKIELLAPDNKP